MSYPFTPGTGAGQQAEPKSEPRPEAKPVAEAAPTSAHLGYAKTGAELPPSDRGPIAPAFSQFSKILGAELERDRKAREATVAGALGIDQEMADARRHKAQIAKVVQDGEMTESRAAELWNNLHPSLKPEDVK